MSKIISFFISFLCLITTGSAIEVLELQKLINNHIYIYSDSNPFSYEIRMEDDYISFYGIMITSFHPTEYTSDTTPYVTIDKLYGFEVVTNCEFARWTITKIFEFIEIYPLFQEKENIFSEIYKTEFTTTFKKNVENFLNHVGKIEKLIKLLHKILYLKSYTFYDDTSIIKNLFTLLIKSHYISLLKEDDNITHSEILRLIITEIIELQRYMLINCADVPSSIKYPQFYGLWVDIYVDKIYAMRKFNDLLRIENKNLKLGNLNEDFCHVNQLLKIVDISRNLNLFKEIGEVQISITDDKYILIKDIVKQIQINYDIQVLFWCHEAILRGLVKIIFGKIIYMVDKGTNIKNLKDTILNIYKEAVRTNAPLYVIQGFEILSKLDTYVRFEFLKVLNEFTDSLIKREYELSFTQVRLDELNSEVSGNTQFDDNVEELLKIVSENIKNFNCFHYFFKPVQDDYSKYFRPLVNNKEILISKNTEQLASDCNFIRNMLILGKQAIHFMKVYFHRDPNLFDKLKEVIFHLKNYFLLIVNKVTDDVDILTLAYKVSAIMVNYTIDTKVEWLEFKTKRILNVIMNEIVDYGIKICTANTINFPLFSNISTKELINTEITYSSINDYFNIKVANFNLDDLNFKTSIIDEDYQYFSVHHIYVKFINNSNISSTYENKIHIIWHGLKMSLKDIFYRESVIIFNPLIVYALYNVYFAFNAAVIFFRIKEIISKNDFETIKTNFNTLNQQLCTHNNWYDLFPVPMKPIVADINDLLLNFPESIQTLKKKKEEIEKKFEMFSILFKSKNKISSVQQIMSSAICNCIIFNNNLLAEETFEEVLNELFENHKKMFKYYLKIIRDGSKKSD